MEDVMMMGVKQSGRNKERNIALMARLEEIEKRLEKLEKKKSISKKEGENE